jgi:hypothetical protein
MRCASTDYKFSTASKLTYSGGKINGSWSETTYDAAGSVSGAAAGNTVHAIISGDKVSGRMSINVSGSSHTINIVQFDPKSGSYRQARAFRCIARSDTAKTQRDIVSRERRWWANRNAPPRVAPSFYVVLQTLSVLTPDHANHSWAL